MAYCLVGCKRPQPYGRAEAPQGSGGGTMGGVYSSAAESAPNWNEGTRGVMARMYARSSGRSATSI